MKRFLTLIFCLAISFIGYTQPCVPTGIPGGGEGVYPVPDSIPCIERNLPYDFTMQIVNFDTLSINYGLGTADVAVHWTRIDSIVNLPCGITWQSDSLTYSPLEQGCIKVSGTTSEIVGQYPLGVFVSVRVNIPGIGDTTVSTRLSNLERAVGSGIDYDYVSRVINAGDTCPNRDNNLYEDATPSPCPGLGAEIVGDTAFCASTTLTAVPLYEIGNVTYLWNDNSTADTLVVSAAGTYSVTVTDQSGTASASFTVVDANVIPEAAFTVEDIYGLEITLTNTSTLSTTYAWDFGDGNNSTVKNPVHLYPAPGTYTITLIAFNSCNSDTTSLDTLVKILPCTPDTARGIPGISPPPDNIPCIVRNLPYDETMQVENFDTFTITIDLLGNEITVDAAVVWTTIDSVTNLPCGITWESDRLRYRPNQTGCIKVSGNSREIPGQYPVKIYMSLQLDLGNNIPIQTRSGELQSLIEDLEGVSGPQGYDFKYVSRVINQGDNCPARDTNATGVGSGDDCPALSAEITGTLAICSGQPTTLTAVPKYETPPITYLWSDNSTSKTFTASTIGTYSVTITDANGTATDTVTLANDTIADASFVPVSVPGMPNGRVNVNNTSKRADSYLWDFGGGNTSTLPTPPTFTYTSNGLKTITLTVTNICGSDTETQTINVGGVFVTSIEYALTFDMFPNPSTGTVALQFTAENAKEVYELNIFDLSGKNVYREKITSASGMVQKQLDLNALPHGVYTLRLDSEKGFGVKKLILN